MKFKISLLFLTILLFIAGCSEPSKKSDNSAVIPVEINVDFDYKVNTDMSVNFTSNISGVPEYAVVTYKWNFGGEVLEAGKESEQNPSVTYKDYGSYQVSLTIDVNGVEYTSSTKEITLSIDEVSVDFSYNINGKQITFTPFLTPEVSVEPIYTWNFGGNVTENDQTNTKTPTVTYAEYGEYIVNLTVTVGGKDFKSQDKTIILDNTPIVAHNYNLNASTATYLYFINGKLYISESKFGYKLREHFFSLDNDSIKKMVMGYNAYAMVTEKGNLYTWGRSDYGALGFGLDKKYVAEPALLDIDGKKIKDIILFNNYSDDAFLALTDDGNVYGWGYNSGNRLALSSSENAGNPEIIENLKNKNIIDLKIIQNVVFALSSDGKLYNWGQDASNGTLGLGDTGSQTLPAVIPALENINIKNIFIPKGNGSFIYAIADNGEIYSWGNNEQNGLLGHGNTAYIVKTPTKVDMTNITGKIKNIVISSSKSIYMLSEDGQVYANGQTTNGQLGIPSDDTKILSPAKLEIPNNDKIKNIEVSDGKQGSYAVFLISESGKIYTAGSSYNGQLGLGQSSGNALTPTLISSLENEKIVKFKNVNNSSYAITDKGALYVWGDNQQKQLGIDHIPSSNRFIYEPVKVENIDGFVSNIAYDDKNVYILLRDGRVFASGYNFKNGLTEVKYVPEQ